MLSANVTIQESKARVSQAVQKSALPRQDLFAWSQTVRKTLRKLYGYWPMPQETRAEDIAEIIEKLSSSKASRIEHRNHDLFGTTKASRAQEKCDA